MKISCRVFSFTTFSPLHFLQLSFNQELEGRNKWHWKSWIRTVLFLSVSRRCLYNPNIGLLTPRIHRKVTAEYETRTAKKCVMTNPWFRRSPPSAITRRTRFWFGIPFGTSTSGRSQIDRIQKITIRTCPLHCEQTTSFSMLIFTDFPL